MRPRATGQDHRNLRDSPKIVAGEWRAELLGGGSLHLGGTTNLKREPHAIEFSFMTLPALAIGPGEVGLAAVVMLMCPAEPVVNRHPGLFMQNGPATMIDLAVTRALFSDLLPRFEAGKIRHITFNAEKGAEAKLPISSWSVSCALPEIAS